jgi:hypothetical protein
MNRKNKQFKQKQKQKVTYKPIKEVNFYENKNYCLHGFVPKRFV